MTGKTAARTSIVFRIMTSFAMLPVMRRTEFISGLALAAWCSCVCGAWADPHGVSGLLYFHAEQHRLFLIATLAGIPTGPLMMWAAWANWTFWRRISTLVYSACMALFGIGIANIVGHVTPGAIECFGSMLIISPTAYGMRDDR